MAKFLLVSLLSLFLMAAEEPTKPGEPPPTTQSGSIERADKSIPISPPRSDGAIAKRLAKIFKITEWFEGLKVTSDEGVVTIAGKVKEGSQRDWAINLAQDADGVVAVVDKIDIAETPWFDLNPTKNELKKLWKGFFAFLPRLLIGLTLLILSYYAFRGLSGWAKRFWSGKLTNPLLSDLMARIGALPVLLVGFYLFLQVLGLTGLAVSLLGTTGAIGLIAGFAFKNILENYFSGIMLSVRRPFIVGDVVSVAGEKGVVYSLSSRGTTLVDFDGNHILIPNSIIFTSVIKNQSSSPLTRVHFTVEVEPGKNPEAEKQKLLNYIKGRTEIVADPKVEANLVKSEKSVRIDAYFWINVQETSADKLKQFLKSKMEIDETVKSAEEPELKTETPAFLKTAIVPAANQQNVLPPSHADARTF